jgi:hypothetical protein
MSTRCKSCSAEVLWCRTESGKSMPVDAAPTERGNLIVDGAACRVATLFDPPSERYTSHFASCPQSAEHRKAKS